MGLWVSGIVISILLFYGAPPGLPDSCICAPIRAFIAFCIDRKRFIGEVGAEHFLTFWRTRRLGMWPEIEAGIERVYIMLIVNTRVSSHRAH